MSERDWRLEDEAKRLTALGFQLDTPERDPMHTPGRCVLLCVGYSMHTGDGTRWAREYMDSAGPMRRDLSHPELPGWDVDDAKRIIQRGDFDVIERVWWQPFCFPYHPALAAVGNPEGLPALLKALRKPSCDPGYGDAAYDESWHAEVDALLDALQIDEEKLP